MIPTEEEKQKIQEAQLANPDVPLGSAEQFLLTLSSISELSARLQLWAFKMDYEATEKVCMSTGRFKGRRGKPKPLSNAHLRSQRASECGFIGAETDAHIESQMNSAP